MSSEKLKKQKTTLAEREKRIKNELSESSEAFEGQVKKVGKIALTTGISLWVGYKAFKYFTRDKDRPDAEAAQSHTTPQPVAPSPPPKSKTPQLNVKALILEKLLAALVKYGTAQLTSLLAKKLEPDDDEEKEQA